MKQLEHHVMNAVSCHYKTKRINHSNLALKDKLVLPR